MKLKKKTIAQVYHLLNSVKLAAMETADKFKVIKVVQAMKVAAKSYDEYIECVQEKLKGDDFETMSAKVRRWQDEGENTTLTVKERCELNAYFTRYQQDVADCLTEESEKEVEISTERLPESIIGKLIDGNDWTVEQCVLLMESVG